MSRGRIIKAMAVFFGGIVLVFAAEHRFDGTKKAVIKPRATHADIAKRQKPRSDDAGRKEVSRADVLKTEHRRTRQMKKGLVSRSTIVSSAYDWSMVPKGAILHVPPLFEKRVNKERNGKLIAWQEFYGKNRAWIRAVPVTIEQARGDVPISEEQLAALKGAGQLLVAVCRGGPISVLKPKEEPQNADPKLAAAELEKQKIKAAEQAQSVKDLMRRLIQRQR